MQLSRHHPDSTTEEPPLTHHDDDDRGRPSRTVLVGLALIQNSLFGGVLYGWASIDRTLLVADPHRGGAGLDPYQTTLIFAVASSTAMFANLLLGAILDAHGPRACSMLSHATIALGFTTFALATSWHQHAIGAALMAFGGPGIQVSVVHISNLFPDRQFFVLSGLTGSMSISFSVLSAFDGLWESYARRGLSARHLFGGHAMLAVASLIASCLVWPDASFPPPTHNNDDDQDEHVPTAEEEYVEAITAHSHWAPEQPLQSDLRQASTNGTDEEMTRLLRKPSYVRSRDVLLRGEGGSSGPHKVSLKDQPFGRQLVSSQYLLAVLSFLATCFLANFYVASFSTEIADAYTYSTAEQHQLARRLTTIMSCGVLASFVAGSVMDHVGPDACQLITLVLGQLQLVVLLTMGNSKPWLTLGFVLYCLFRQFLFPTFIASITDKLGFKYFGLLNGLAFAFSGVSQVFMSSLVMAVQGTCHQAAATASAAAQGSSVDPCSPGQWTTLHVIEIILLAALMLAPRLAR